MHIFASPVTKYANIVIEQSMCYSNRAVNIQVNIKEER